MPGKGEASLIACRDEQRADRILNALTIDVEDYYHVEAFKDVIQASSWASRQSRVETNTRRLLDLLAEQETVATFFVLGWVAERHPVLVREIAQSGHEVACHGYSHNLVYRQTPKVFREETRRAKLVLEAQSQRRVRGYRAASWSITAKSRWALDVLTDLGFEYDSSIFPIRHDLYGEPGGERRLHRRTSRTGELVELPPATLSVAGWNVPVGGGGYFRLLPYGVTRRALRWINRYERQPFVFYLHPWEIDPDQPRIKGSWKSRLRHYVNLHRVEPRLKRLLQEFRFTRVDDLLVGLDVDAGFGVAPPVRVVHT